MAFGERRIARKISRGPSVEIRMGTITALSAGPPRRVTATVAGVSIPNIPILDSAAGTVGKNVWIISMGKGRLLAIGSS